MNVGDEVQTNAKIYSLLKNLFYGNVNLYRLCFIVLFPVNLIIFPVKQLFHLSLEMMHEMSGMFH